MALITIFALYQSTLSSRRKMYTTIIVLSFFLTYFNVHCASICDSECMCRLSQNHGQDFQGEVVDCSYNPSILATEYSLPSLVHTLDLSLNNLTRIYASNIFNSKTVIELILSNNDIVEIDPNAFTMPELKILDLRYNQLEFISEDVFKNLRNLERLNLANNRFTTFAKLTFHNLPNLKEIILDNNNIGMSLKKFNLFNRNGFGLTHKIKYMGISGINLNRVPDNFFIEAYDLQRLDISNNNLSEIFEIPYTLVSLDLSDNPIADIAGEDFSELPALKDLKLNNLQIKEVPDYVFEPLRGLLNLELERNQKLTKFSTVAFGGEVLEDAENFLLERLSLRMSRLTALDEQLMEPFGQLVHLDLEGNSWKCDCKLAWLKKLQIKPKYTDNLRCASPRPLLNKRIFDLDEKSFVCTVNSHYVGIAIAGVAFCVILSTIALWLCLFMPKYQSRCNFLQNMSTPYSAYVLLPTARNHHM